MFDIDWRTPAERWDAIVDADHVGEWETLIEQGAACPVCGMTGGGGHYPTACGLGESPDDAETPCPLCANIDARMAAACTGGEGIEVDKARVFDMVAPF